MERIFSDDERIRRAEEIYLRRNDKNINLKKMKKLDYKTTGLKVKIALNLILMINIAIIVVCIQNKNYIFTESFLNDTNRVFLSMQNGAVDYYRKIVNNMDENMDETSEENEVIKEEENNTITNSVINEITKEESVSSSLNEMETDIINLKNAYSFINPTEGTISSMFGNRESNKINVDGYHTGLDIANEKGSMIKCSMQGIVEEVSNKGDYGNHLKIRCNNVITLYAHCENIFVEEGQIVSQGQEIASMGSSGNTTGPHLHFEIRVDSRYVDPMKILEY